MAGLEWNDPGDMYDLVNLAGRSGRIKHYHMQLIGAGTKESHTIMEFLDAISFSILIQLMLNCVENYRNLVPLSAAILHYIPPCAMMQANETAPGSEQNVSVCG